MHNKDLIRRQSKKPVVEAEVSNTFQEYLKKLVLDSGSYNNNRCYTKTKPISKWTSTANLPIIVMCTIHLKKGTGWIFD